MELQIYNDKFTDILNENNYLIKEIDILVNEVNSFKNDKKKSIKQYNILTKQINNLIDEFNILIKVKGNLVNQVDVLTKENKDLADKNDVLTEENKYLAEAIEYNCIINKDKVINSLNKEKNIIEDKLKLSLIDNINLKIKFDNVIEYNNQLYNINKNMLVKLSNGNIEKKHKFNS
jgi:hypothetical protein